MTAAFLGHFQAYPITTWSTPRPVPISRPPTGVMGHGASDDSRWDMMVVVAIPFASTFGCDYCRDDQNRLYGHVTQIGSDDSRDRILLRCPRCDALDENRDRGEDLTRRLTEAEARELYGFPP